MHATRPLHTLTCSMVFLDWQLWQYSGQGTSLRAGGRSERSGGSSKRPFSGSYLVRREVESKSSATSCQNLHRLLVWHKQYRRGKQEHTTFGRRRFSHPLPLPPPLLQAPPHHRALTSSQEEDETPPEQKTALLHASTETHFFLPNIHPSFPPNTNPPPPPYLDFVHDGT